MFKHLAYSLLELMVALTILIIIVFLAAPNYHNGISSVRADSYLKQLVQVITYAQQQARLRGTAITICALNSALECQPDEVGNSELLVFIDSDKSHVLKDKQYILKNIAIPKFPAKLLFKGLQKQITISADGSMEYQNSSFSYLVNNNVIRQLIISPSGRLRVEIMNS
jgi:type IV fimbrial biogenesis protein FimT